MNALLKIAASELFIKRHAKNQAENANKHARFVGTAAGVGTVAGVDLLAPRLTKKLSKNMFLGALIGGGVAGGHLNKQRAVKNLAKATAEYDAAKASHKK